jgi:hypothetical protein
MRVAGHGTSLLQLQLLKAGKNSAPFDSLLAPEAKDLSNLKSTTAMADVYALGVLVAKLLSSDDPLHSSGSDDSKIDNFWSKCLSNQRPSIQDLFGHPLLAEMSQNLAEQSLVDIWDPEHIERSKIPRPPPPPPLNFSILDGNGLPRSDSVASVPRDMSSPHLSVRVNETRDKITLAFKKTYDKMKTADSKVGSNSSEGPVRDEESAEGSSTVAQESASSDDKEEKKPICITIPELKDADEKVFHADEVHAIVCSAVERALSEYKIALQEQAQKLIFDELTKFTEAVVAPLQVQNEILRAQFEGESTARGDKTSRKKNK